MLLTLRPFELDSQHSDIIHKYTSDEARTLKSYGEISDILLNTQDLNTEKARRIDDDDDYNIFDVDFF